MNHAQNLCVGLIFDALSREHVRLSIRDTFTFSRNQVSIPPLSKGAPVRTLEARLVQN